LRNRGGKKKMFSLVKEVDKACFKGRGELGAQDRNLGVVGSENCGGKIEKQRQDEEEGVCPQNRGGADQETRRIQRVAVW